MAPSIPVEIASRIRVAVETDWWLFAVTALGGTASAAVAIFTGFLAAKTAALARETKRLADKTADLAKETLESIRIARVGNAVAEQHHQESQSPVVVLSAINLQFDDTMPKPEPGSTSGVATFKLSYRISNVGFGPALRLQVVVHIAGVQDAATVSEGALAAGEVREPVGHHPIGLPVNRYPYLLPRFPSAVLVVNYNNVYGQSRSTLYQLGASKEATNVLSEAVSPQALDESRTSDALKSR